jgi:hypothetical protein
MDDLIQLVLSTILHPTSLAFALGGIVSFIFVAATMCYYNRRGRGG